MQLQAEEDEFTDFISRYNKEYTEEEYQTRFSIFRDNVAFIRLKNSLNLDYFLGVNEFADMTFEEFKAIYLPTRFMTRADRKTSGNVKNLEDLPTTVDWRTKGAVTPVKNQGKCGSCWAFSATGAVEGAWKLTNGTLVALSEQELIDCTKGFGNQGCEGGEMDYAFKYMIKNGITSETIYPYTAKNGKCKVTLASESVAEIRNFTDVLANNTVALQTAVSQQPISVAVEADQAAWQYYKGGIVSNNCGTDLDHGVLIVGYSTLNKPNYWIVKNSWGQDWGEQGYIRIAITSGAGVCGINLDPSYPTALSQI